VVGLVAVGDIERIPLLICVVSESVVQLRLFAASRLRRKTATL
jgi:hypothetical protein